MKNRTDELLKKPEKEEANEIEPSAEEPRNGRGLRLVLLAAITVIVCFTGAVVSVLAESRTAVAIFGAIAVLCLIVSTQLLERNPARYATLLSRFGLGIGEAGPTEAEKRKLRSLSYIPGAAFVVFAGMALLVRDAFFGAWVLVCFLALGVWVISYAMGEPTDIWRLVRKTAIIITVGILLVVAGFSAIEEMFPGFKEAVTRKAAGVFKRSEDGPVLGPKVTEPVSPPLPVAKPAPPASQPASSALAKEKPRPPAKQMDEEESDAEETSEPANAEPRTASAPVASEEPDEVGKLLNESNKLLDSIGGDPPPKPAAGHEPSRMAAPAPARPIRAPSQQQVNNKLSGMPTVIKPK